MNTNKTLFAVGQMFLVLTGWFISIPPKTKGDDYKTFCMSNAIVITKRFIDPITKIEKIVLSDLDKIEIVEDADILSSFKLPSLIKYGFSINEKYTKQLGFALQQMRAKTPISTLKEGVGVLNYNNVPFISLNKAHFNKSIANEQRNAIMCKSKYDLEPKGTFEGWWQMYLDEVKGNLLLELAVIFSVSSLVTAYLKNLHEVEFAGTIFSFMGNSSTGKSTAASLGLSVVSNPSKGRDSLFRSWNATRNALEAFLAYSYGVPVVLDELSSATFADTTGLLYSLSEGQGRQRANRDGDVKEPRHFGTSIISTSEHSIFKDSSKNDGLRVRTIEITERFTTSAENSDAIKKGIATNYGHVMPLVAEYLLNREQEVIQWFRTEHQWFKTQLENETSNTGIRMFKRYATITTSARILERVIATPVDLDAVRKYLVDYHVNSVSERSLADKAIDVIVQFVMRNRGKFAENAKLSTMIENFGLIQNRDNCIQVKMLKDVFKQMLQDNQFEDEQNVIDALRDKGYMESDRNRRTTKRSIKDAQGKSRSIVFYHLKLDKELAPIFGLSSNSEPFAPPQFNGTTNKHLLDDFSAKAKEWEGNDDLDL